MQFPSLDFTNLEIPTAWRGVYEMFLPRETVGEIAGVENSKYLKYFDSGAIHIRNAGVKASYCLLLMVRVRKIDSGKREYYFPTDITERCEKYGRTKQDAWKLKKYSLQQLKKSYQHWLLYGLKTYLAVLLPCLRVTIWMWKSV